jgi:hypothetical protein
MVTGGQNRADTGFPQLTLAQIQRAMKHLLSVRGTELPYRLM